MIELELRPARIEDLPLFVALVRSDSPEPGELNASEQALRAEFGEIGDNRMIYLAFAEGEVTAGAQLVLESADNDPELADGTNIAHVHHLRVAYQCRRQGIGRRLMLHLEREARRLGFERLTLGVDSWNEPAIAFYEALGYALLKEVLVAGGERCSYLFKRLGS